MSTKRAKRVQVPMDDDDNPDIYVLTNDEGLSLKDAAERAGITLTQAAMLLYKQEPVHDASLRIKVKGVDESDLADTLAEQYQDGIRWERLAARSGLSRAKVRELVASSMGVEVDDLKTMRTNAKDEEEEEAPKKAPPKRGKAAAKRTKAKAEPEPDEDDEDEEEVDEDEEEEAPAPKAKTRRRTRST